MQKDDQANIAAIEQMFDEFSKRNYSFRIPITRRNTYLDALSVYLNLFADDFQTCLREIELQSNPINSSTNNDPAQKLSEYILLHLEEPLPTLRTLSRMFNTNERKLKERFRALYHTSIYRYYNQARMRKARAMILKDDLPLQNIADQCGFKNYPNFSNAFKKHFGYAPIMLRLK